MMLMLMLMLMLMKMMMMMMMMIIQNVLNTMLKILEISKYLLSPVEAFANLNNV